MTAGPGAVARRPASLITRDAAVCRTGLDPRRAEYPPCGTTIQALLSGSLAEVALEARSSILDRPTYVVEVVDCGDDDISQPTSYVDGGVPSVCFNFERVRDSIMRSDLGLGPTHAKMY
jgi:hypothetical protein